MSDAVKRPPLLVGACLYLGLLASVISVRAIGMVSSWNADGRADEVAGALRALRDAGVSAAGAESAYKVVVTAVAVLGATGAVFAFFTARGDRASRVGTTVAVGLAGLATFCGVLGPSFFLVLLGALAVAFTVRLWTGEVRTYFRTLAGHPAPEPKTTPAPAPVPAPDPAPVPSPAPVLARPVGRPDALPRSVAVAGWTALAGSVSAVLLGGLWVLVFVVAGLDYDSLVRFSGARGDLGGSSQDDVEAALRVYNALMSVTVVLGLGGVLASALVLLRRRGAGTFLFVVTVAALVVSALVFPFGLPWTAAAVVALVQLRKPDAQAWFARS